MIFLEGINDITHPDTPEPRFPCLTKIPISADDLIGLYEQVIARAHAHGLRIYGATLTPSGGYGPFTPAMEAKRRAVNEWIRTSGAYDGVIDFAAVIADPGDPSRMAAQYDSGDHLHPQRRRPAGDGRCRVSRRLPGRPHGAPRPPPPQLGGLSGVRAVGH